MRFRDSLFPTFKIFIYNEKMEKILYWKILRENRKFLLCPRHVREFKTVLDSGCHSVDSGFRYWIPAFVSGTGFWIPIVSGISDSLSCIPIPKPRIPDSIGKIFLDSRFSQIPESVCPCMGRIMYIISVLLQPQGPTRLQFNQLICSL